MLAGPTIESRRRTQSTFQYHCSGNITQNDGEPNPTLNVLQMRFFTGTTNKHGWASVLWKFKQNRFPLFLHPSHYYPKAKRSTYYALDLVGLPKPKLTTLLKI